MKSLLWAFVLALAACSTGGTDAPEKEASPPSVPKLPNIVLFSIDTLRADHLGIAGHSGDISPRLDSFGRESVVFERAVSQAPSTTPSHMSLFTGLTPAVHRVVNVDRDNPAVRPLEPFVPTFPERLQKEGYYTVGLHAGGNMEGDFGFDRGFHLYSQDFISYNWVKAYKEPEDLDVIRQWLRIGKERGRPLFLFLHHYVCHVPYVSAPEAIRERYLSGKKVPGLTTGPSDETKIEIADALDALPSSRRQLIGIARLYSSRLRWSFWSGVDMARPDHRAHVMALYDASVSYADLLFGRVMDILKEEGLYDNSIIIVTSDHGEEFFEHGGREHGRLFTEHLHVPLMMRFPAGAGLTPRTVKGTVRLFDVLPTVMDYLKLPAIAPVQAQSFLPLVDGRGGYAPLVLSYNGPELQFLRIEKGGYSWADEGYQGSPQTLFDLRADPAEQTNLASARPDLLVDMERIAEKQRAEDAALLERLGSAAPGAQPPDPRLVEQLEALGYLNP
jgi:arylsulfatase A-like enzyme